MIKWWISEGILLISTWIDKSSTLEWVSFANSTSTCPILNDLGKDFNFEGSEASCNLHGNPPAFWLKSSGGALTASLMLLGPMRPIIILTFYMNPLIVDYL